MVRFNDLVLAACVALSMAACVSAFTVPAFGRLPVAARLSATRSLMRARRATAPALRMSELNAQTALEESVEVAAPGEYFGIDGDGNKVKLSLQEAEKRYLDACNAFYNDNTKVMTDEEFDNLREDLAFQGSSVTTMSRMEIMFMVAANRYAEGRPVMNDAEFDNLRRQLKARNSAAVVHKVPTCRVDTLKCKADLTVDDVKNTALYVPVFPVVAVVWLEAAYLVSGGGLGPIVNLLVNLPFIAVFSYLIKNFVLFQNPMVVRTACPQCYTEQNIYFGDILWARGSDPQELKTECVNKACGCELRAFRERMFVESDLPKNGIAPEPVKT